MRIMRSKKHMSGKNNHKEKGVALVIITLVLLLLSVLIIAGNNLTLSEISSTSNYRLSTQAFYVAESGVERSMQWFSYYYTPQNWPSLDTTKYPCQLSGNPI